MQLSYSDHLNRLSIFRQWHEKLSMQNIGRDRSEQTVKLQTRLLLIRIYTICHFICISWTHYCIVKPDRSIFTTKMVGVDPIEKRGKSENGTTISSKVYFLGPNLMVILVMRVLCVWFLYIYRREYVSF